MHSEVLIGLLAFAGTLIGSLGGILAAAKLTNHRLEQLEKTVEKHNGVLSRVVVIEENIKVINHRLKDIEDEK